MKYPNFSTGVNTISTHTKLVNWASWEIKWYSKHLRANLNCKELMFKIYVL